MRFKAIYNKIEVAPRSIRSELWVTASLQSDSEEEILIQKIDIATVYITCDSNPYRFHYPKIYFKPTYLRKGGSLRFQVILDLSQSELDKIENMRTKNVKLNFWGEEASYFELEGVPPFKFRTESFETVNVDGSREWIIPHSQWVDFLKELKYKDVKLFEIPILDDSPLESLKEITPYLEKATKSFREGNYDDVLTSCRKSIEKFREFYPHECKEDASPECEEKRFKNVFKEFLKSNSKTELIDDLIGKIRAFSTKGVHINSVISRKDAELCLGITLELFRYIGRTLKPII